MPLMLRIAGKHNHNHDQNTSRKARARLRLFQVLPSSNHHSRLQKSWLNLLVCVHGLPQALRHLFPQRRDTTIMTTTKTPQELADYLRRANIWRRSDTDEPMPDPTELGKAIDQVIDILEEQAQPHTIARSNCCEAPALTACRPNSTQWHVCPECCKPCDVYF